MAAPIVYSGRRSKLLTPDGLALQSGRTIDYDGPVNYLPNPNLELNAAGWSACTVPLTGLVPSGAPSTAGVSGTRIFTRTTTTPISGAGSLRFSDSAIALAAGQGFMSDAFTVNRSHLGKVLQLRFSYEILHALANMNGSGTTANTWAIWFYDTTAGTWHQPAGVYNIVNASGPVAAQPLTFQMPGTNLTYRLVFFAQTASTGIVDMLFDDFELRAQITTPVPMITDWNTSLGLPTITGVGTVTNVSCETRRIGETLQVRGQFTGGTAEGVPFRVGIPGGLSFDTSKYSTTQSRVLGLLIEASATVRTYPSTGVGPWVLTNDNTTPTAVTLATATSTATGLFQLSNGTAVFTAGDVYHFSFEVQILGWSTNVIASSESSEGRVVAFAAERNNGSIGSGSFVANNNWPAAGLVVDTVAGFDALTGEYTIKVPGWYSVIVSVAFAANATGLRTTRILINGTAQARGEVVGSSIATNEARATLIRYLKAGDKITTDVFQNSGGSLAFVPDYQYNKFQLHMLQGPATVGAGETLLVQASTAAGQAVGVSGNVLVFGTVSYSTHGTGAYNPATGIFTALTPGNYRFTAAICTATYTPASGNQLNIVIRKGGTLLKELCCINTVSVSGNHRVSGSHEVYLLLGETIDLVAASNLTATTLYTDGRYNTLAISKVG